MSLANSATKHDRDDAIVRELSSIWEARVKLGDRGYYPSTGNLALILAHEAVWSKVLAYDVRSERVVLAAPPPWDATAERWLPRMITDADSARIAIWLESSKWEIRVSPDSSALGGAIDVVAHAHAIDPVRTYLDSLTWDQHWRLNLLARDYFGAADDERLSFSSAALAKWMISAVARVYAPACQVDHAPVFVGPQGRGKSTSLRTLTGPEWFADSLPDLARDRDAAEYLRGKWIIELGEIETLTRAEAGTLKAFLTRRSDDYREAYGRRTQGHPRRVVFAGSVNHDEFLRDSTGNRRWWPVAVGRIDTDAIARDRDQLWAEAVHRYRSGEPWHLTTADEIEGAQAAQDERFAVDAWEGVIVDWLRTVETVTVADVLRGALNLETGRWGQGEANRVARILQRLGWSRRQVREGTRREWRYMRGATDV